MQPGEGRRHEEGLDGRRGDGGQNHASARLDGYQETPAVSTEATGRFTADVGSDSIEYRLTFSGLSSDVLFAHIHFGRRATAGGVSAFLCGGGTAPVCPGFRMQRWLGATS